ncbi:MAG: hypothetical protein MJ230_04305 [bacterium]|nr:hypothetical protein [bacterium]
MRVNTTSTLNNESVLIDKVRKLKAETQLSILLGDYKTAKNSSRELAKIGVDHFELVTKVPNTVQGSVPIFSKFGLRIIGYMLYSLFAIKLLKKKSLRIWLNYLKKDT